MGAIDSGLIARESMINIHVNVNTDELEAFNRQLDRLEAGTGNLADTLDRATRASKDFNSAISTGNSKINSFNTRLRSSNDETVRSYQRMADESEANLKRISEQLSKVSSANTRMTNKATKSGEKLADAGKLTRDYADTYVDSMAKVRDVNVETAKSYSELNHDSRVKTSRTTTSQGRARNGSALGHTSTDDINKQTSALDKWNKAGSSMIDVGRNMSLTSLGLGATFLQGAKDASQLQQSYNYITNLAVTSGEKRAEALKNVNAMQKENNNLSVQYGISQTDLANGDTELVHAGYSTNAALAAHKDLVQGAIASNQDYSSVMDNVTNVLDAYGLRTNNVNKMEERTKMVTNQLAYSVDHGKASFQDFGESLKYVGNSSHQANQHLSETMSALTILSKNGIDGSLAGTGLRKVLKTFASPGQGMGGAGQRTVMKQLGLNSSDFRDSQGRLKQISDLMGLIQSRIDSHHLKHYESSIMTQFFGTTGENVASTLAENAESMKAMNDQVARADKMKGGGYVQWLAGKNMQNANNQLKVFQQAWKAFGIATANTLLPTFTDTFKWLDKLMLGLNDMGPTAKKWVAWSAMLLAAFAPLTLVFGSLIKAISAPFKVARWFKGKISSNFGNSVNDTNKSISRSSEQAREQLQKTQEQIDRMHGNESVSVDSNSTSSTGSSENNWNGMTREEYQASRNMGFWERTKSRFGGVEKTGTKFGRVADDAHLLGDTGKDAGYIAEHAGGMTRGARYLTGIAGLGTVAKLGTSKAGGLLTSGLSKLGNSKLLTGAKAIGSKIPFLDLALASTNLIGINHKNAGQKLGSTGGMAGGTIAGGAIGSLLDPFTFGMGTLGGAALGGWLGQKGGGELGKKIQKMLPKHPFQSIEKGWDSLTNKISHSSFGKSTSSMFGSVKRYAIDNFKPVGKAWESMIKDAQKAWHSVSSMFGSTGSSIDKALKPASQAIGSFMKALHTTTAGKDILKGLGIAFQVSLLPVKTTMMTVSDAFKVSMSLIKAVSKGTITFLSDSFSGLFKTIGGIFKIGTDILTGNWKHLGTDLKSIGNGINEIMTAPFDAARTAIKSIFGDIEHTAEGVWNSIKNMGSKVGNFLKHPISSVTSMFKARAIGGNVLKDEMALVNEQGPESAYDPRKGTFRFLGNGGPMITRLYAGEHVLTAAETQRLSHGGFPKGTKLNGYANGRGNVEKPGVSTSMKQMVGTVKVVLDSANVRVAQKLVKSTMDDMNKLVTKTYDDTFKQSNALADKFEKSSASNWDGIYKDTDKLTDKMSSDTNDTYTQMSKDTVKSLDDLHSQSNDITKSMVTDFGNIMDGLQKLAQQAMQDAINQLNNGVNGINASLQEFGGNTQVLKPIHFANGTNGALQNDQLAMVNDATAGPRQEAIVRNEQIYLPQGRNTIMNLQQGDEVLNGYQTQRLMQMSGINHYASGSGVSDSRLDEIAKNNAKDPDNTWANTFAKSLHFNVGSQLTKALTGSIANGMKSIGQSWTGAMWNLIEDTIDGGGGSGSLGAFLKYAEKIGMGKRYVMGATGPDAFDCSGLVYTALKHFGITIGRNTVAEQADPKVHNLGKDINKAQVGDLAIFGHGGGADGHVGIISNISKGLMMNATPPSGRISSIQAAIPYVPGGLAGYYHVDGLSSADTGKNKSNGLLDKLVKSELGSKALNWITKTLGPKDDGGGAGGDSPAPTGDHKHWLEQAGISAKDFGAANYIISHESGWNPHATNPDGGAYGLPQSLPASKMASAGRDWHDNPITQLKWMKSYVDGRYGGFQEAQAYWEKNHNYANGGWASEPSIFGEVPGEPEVAINPKRPSADRLIQSAIDARVRNNPSSILRKFATRGQATQKAKKLYASAKSAIMGNRKRNDENSNNNKFNFTANISININGNASKSDANTIAQEVRKQVKEQVNQVFRRIDDANFA